MTTRLEFLIPDAHWLSANDRYHWADKAKRTKALRECGRMTTEANGVRDLPTSHIAAFIGYPRNGKADPANAAPTVKALVDGMVDAGAWPDDDSTYVIGPTYLRGDKSPAGNHSVRLVITSQDIPWLDGAA